MKKAHEQALDCEGKLSVSHFLEKELLEAFQQSGVVINSANSPNTPGGTSTGNGNNANPNTSQKIAAVGKAMFGMASKAMNWFSSMGDEEVEDI